VSARTRYSCRHSSCPSLDRRRRRDRTSHPSRPRQAPHRQQRHSQHSWTMDFYQLTLSPGISRNNRRHANKPQADFQIDMLVVLKDWKLDLCLTRRRFARTRACPSWRAVERARAPRCATHDVASCSGFSRNTVLTLMMVARTILIIAMAHHWL